MYPNPIPWCVKKKKKMVLTFLYPILTDAFIPWVQLISSKSSFTNYIQRTWRYLIGGYEMQTMETDDHLKLCTHAARYLHGYKVIYSFLFGGRDSKLCVSSLWIKNGDVQVTSLLIKPPQPRHQQSLTAFNRNRIYFTDWFKVLPLPLMTHILW